MDDASVERLAADPVDVALALNVLEHIEDDVHALANMGRLVRRGGKVIVFVPALETLYGSLDRLAGHFRRYDRALIEERLRAAGLAPRSVRFFNMIGALGWFVNACVIPQMRLDGAAVDGQVRLYDRYVVRIASAIERRLEPPFGQSLIAVAEKISR
jgi:hypothetical protein